MRRPMGLSEGVTVCPFPELPSSVQTQLSTANQHLHEDKVCNPACWEATILSFNLYPGMFILVIKNQIRIPLILSSVDNKNRNDLAISRNWALMLRENKNAKKP
ncbi:hypothetical protein CIHG_08708 [Coccidioides immitis H538.4]|uniref:Uncharacterized protein n=3 Tax=Coccidioides immitis TaxID=5501 RepID=A0A0J8R159_COCIT|nr:hypothetical protein CIRG_02652 [Coccidioides immitis RMSCC 2394]KMU77403.1 hypothetical protein CISG_06650 [Coccidioides immitis RMSCC 3703]KMU90747.1 hypothetical protein CIHG_08708 [Coccidioides immitis H538.4]